MSVLRVLLADDEPLVRRDLARLLADQPDVEVVGEARNGLEALELIEALAPDVVFLDVQMPELDGLGVVAALDPDHAPAIIFVTAFDYYALQAFDAAAVDYLLKPFDPVRGRRALERARALLTGSRGAQLDVAEAALTGAAGSARRYLDRIAARGTRIVTVIDVPDVTWIEAADNYVRFHTSAGTHLSRRRMRDLERLLDPGHFARVHRSAIVNLHRVRELRSLGDGDQEILLDDGTRLTLTRKYRQAFESRFGGIA
jgi:two-component system LytT family response regulator